jgi:hypothetical protein
MLETDVEREEMKDKIMARTPSSTRTGKPSTSTTAPLAVDSALPSQEVSQDSLQVESKSPSLSEIHLTNEYYRDAQFASHHDPAQFQNAPRWWSWSRLWPHAERL